MTELFDDTQPLGLIDPIDLLEEYVIGHEIVAITLLGIFNPMGPTLIPISLLRDDESEIAYLLVSSLNPFNQTRQLVARVEDNTECLAIYLPLLGESDAESLPKSLPSHMACLAKDEYERAYLAASTIEFLKSIPLTEPLSDTISSYRKYPGDPWARIPSIESMMETTSEKTPVEVDPPSEDDWADWYDVVFTRDHSIAEFQGIVDAWNGSIQNFGNGLPHMPMEEALAELASLGFPFFTPPS
ncbi:MAG: hypothetical protein KJO21_01155 [Verrucomicrobiae bacterium]|nr:hypothetical protein [Verrucomicrobiae bacterium]NNJ42142.1 hypothetical protein [Akkermansiaceae bacterium]